MVVWHTWFGWGGCLWVIMDNVTLDHVDQIQTNDMYNLTKILDMNEEDENALDRASDSCEYYDPSAFKSLMEDKRINYELSLFGINCRSINAHWDSLCHLLTNLQSQDMCFALT